MRIGERKRLERSELLSRRTAVRGRIMLSLQRSADFRLLSVGRIFRSDDARQELWLSEQQICKGAQHIVRTEGSFEDYLISVISKLSVGNLPLLTNSSSSSALFLIPNLSRMVW